MPESLQQLLVTNFGLSPSGYTGSQGELGYVGSAGSNGYTGSAGTSGTSILISNIQVTDSSYTVLDDTAVDTAGGYIKITGSGFASGCSVLINQTPVTSVTYISETEVRAQVPATVAGTYIVYLVNANGDVAIRVNGITFSATPTWVSSGSLSGLNNQAISIQLNATSATSYTLQAGSTLPGNVTLSNVGLISGTVSGLAFDTAYNFTVVAIDAENQDSPRAFTLSISVNEPYFKYTTLLLNADVATTFLSDASTNNFALTTTGNPKPNLRSPFTGYNGSTEFATGDILTTPVSADFSLGSSEDFCVEFWVYYTSAPSGYTFMCYIGGTTNSQYLTIRTGDSGFSNKIQAEFGPGTFAGIMDNGSYTTSYLVNKWTHIALCRTGGRASFFIDGNRAATRTSDTTSLSGNTNFGVNSASPYGFPGYMSNVRWVKGSAVYDPSASTITVPTAPLTAVANTKLLILQSSQPVNNNVFLDSSVNNFAITRNGNTTQGTFTPFGGNWSNYFDGAGDYLAATSPSMSGTWTVELWWFPTLGATQQTIIAFNQGSAGSLAINIWMNTSNQLVVDNGQVASGLFTSGTFTINAWNHVAVVRNGTTTTGYINGTVVGTNTFTPGAVNNVNIGRYPDGNLTTFYYARGYISNARVVVGTAVYTSAFTPSATPLTAISGTSLLTCQSNRFVDNSTNNYVVTKFGDVSVQRFSPFGLSDVYSASTAGGSAYFDGTGDYLSLPVTSSAFTFDGAFTIEAWVYRTGSYMTLIDTRSGGNYTDYVISLNPSGQVDFVVVGGAGVRITTTETAVASQWAHIACVRQGSTVRVYINGVASVNTVTYASTMTPASSQGWIGTTKDPLSSTGYMSNLRIVKGTAVYTANFTPPSAPVTAIAGTSLLCDFTNAGIIDNTMLNNVETVGGAQISKVQSKFGGGSLYFNGSSTCTILASPNLNFGTGDFTIEMWVYSASQSSGGNRTMGNGAGASWGANKWIFTTTTPGNLNKFTWHFWNHNSGSSDLLVSSSASNNSTWTYVAITRSGNTFRMFVNGVIEATGTSSASVDGNIPVQLTLGNSGVAGDSSWTGYIDDLRITQGYARYTANFTPPTSAFPGK